AAAGCLLGALSLSLPAGAEPVIEPQLRVMADAAARGIQTPARLQNYALVDQSQGGEWVDGWLQGPVDRASVEGLGGRVGTVAGSWTTAHVPVTALGPLTTLPGLERAQLAQGLQLQENISVPLIGAPTLWWAGATPGTVPNYPVTGKTGRRVVVGI